MSMEKKIINKMYHNNFLTLKEELGEKFPYQDVFYIVKLCGYAKSGVYMNSYQVITCMKQITDNLLEGLGFDITRTFKAKTLFVVNRVSQTAKPPDALCNWF